MTDKEIIKAFDILDKFEFFGGQRASRELWFNKPIDIQNKDIGDYLRDLDFLKQFINRQQAEIERLKGEIKEKTETITFLKDQAVGWSIDFCNLKNKVKTAKSEAIKEFAIKLKVRALMGVWETLPHVDVDDIDILVKEMEIK